MESSNKKILLIALLLSLATTLIIYIYVSNINVKPAEIEYANVYVAVRTMPAGYKVTDADIKQARIAKELLNSRAVLDKSDIVGKRLKESIIEGEQIIRDRLIDESKAILSYSMPEGKRAVSINVSEQIAVSDLIRPGDFVDVVASFAKEEIDDGNTKTDYPRITKIIIQDVEILAMGQDTAVTEEQLKETPKTITLAVDPQDVEKLVYASEYGVLSLSLRHTGDNETVNTKGADRSDVAPDRGVPVTGNTN